MSGRDHEPLSAEERELALRLSRLDAGTAPSASLDASILAAARTGETAAAPDRASAGRRPRPRWPVAMGLAASLAVAMGVAWQLRPQPDSHLIETSREAAPAHAAIAAADDEAPVAAAAGDANARHGDDGGMRVADQGDAAQLSASGSRDEPIAAAAWVPPPSAAASPDTQARERAATAAAEATRQAEAQRMRADDEAARRSARRQLRQSAAPPAVPVESESATDGRTGPPASETLDFVPPPPPPAPPAPPAAVASPAQAPEAASAARAKPSSPARDSIEFDDTGAAPAASFDVLADQPLDDRPPASADSPDVREDWLQRIRELHQAGRVQDARDSLHEFVRRHPHARVPADLRPLLGE